MRFNSARPIKQLTRKEQEGLRKLLFPTEQPKAFARKPPVDPFTPVTAGTPPQHPVIPWDDPGTGAAYLQADAAPANGRRQHEANQDRPVEGQEITALIFTFGQEVGDYLASQINLVFSPEILDSKGYAVRGKVLSDTEIELVTDFNPYDVADLGIFIHEATHIWQRHTGLHRGTSWLPDRSRRDYDYTLDQLHSLNFNQEQHANAVSNWFIANYAYKHGLIGDAPGQVPADFVWTEPLHQVLGIHPDFFDDNPDENIVESLRIWLINVRYERLINQIQDPTLLRPLVTGLGQNFPNPF